MRSPAVASRRAISSCLRRSARGSRSGQCCCGGVFSNVYSPQRTPWTQREDRFFLCVLCVLCGESNGELAMVRVFLLSPANCGGRRAKQALSPNATFALAAALQSREGAQLGDLFSFISGLYFRGKLTYARRFAQPPEQDNAVVGTGVHIITPTAGLRCPETRITA